MSLTSHLNDPQSPIRQWFDKTIHADFAQNIIQEINTSLDPCERILTQNTDYMLVGTAFDLAFRTYLGPLEASVPMLGAQMLGGDHPNHIRHLLFLTRTTKRIPSVSIVLAWYEGYARGGRNLERLNTPYRMDELVFRIEADPDLLPSIQDVRKLYETVPSVYGDDLTLPYVANPTFAGSEFVGGADADWILGGLLEDCKVSMKRQPMTLEHLYQVLGYALLDWDDKYAITHVGWYFARQRMRIAYPLNVFFSDLRASREKFRDVVMQLNRIDF